MARPFFGDYRPKKFLLQVHPRITERWSDVEAENLGGNDSQRSPIDLLPYHSRDSAIPSGVEGPAFWDRQMRVSFGQIRYCLYTFPSFITNCTCSSTLTSCRGSPETAITSAYLPGL